MTPTGELLRAQQKYAHLSNKKAKKSYKKLKKALSKFEPNKLEVFNVGDLIYFIHKDLPDDYLLTRFWGIVIDKSKSKKKWHRKYKILIETGVWEVTHEQIEKQFRVRKDEN